jgi:hypothetical protein
LADSLCLQGLYSTSAGGQETCLLYSCGDGRVVVYSDVGAGARGFTQLGAAASAISQLQGEDSRPLVKAWVDLYVGSPAPPAAVGTVS